MVRTIMHMDLLIENELKEEIYNLIKSFNDILYKSIEGGSKNV